MRTRATPNGTFELTAEQNAQRDLDEAAVLAEAPTKAILAEIERLEREITPRRLREAMLGVESPSGWLANQESLIAAERSKL